MSKRNTKDHPLTKGGALIQAREILGPKARVWCMLDPLTCFVDSGPGSAQIAMGYSWEEMVEKAKETPEAKAWSQFQIDRDNAHGAAIDSLRAKTKEFLKDSKLMKLLSRSEVKYVLGGLKAR